MKGNGIGEERMKKKGHGAWNRLIQRYRELPAGLRSRRLSERNRAQKLLTLTICIPLMLWGLGYIAHWELTKARIERENAAWSALYVPAEETAAPMVTEIALTAAPTQTAGATPSAAPTQTVGVTPSAEPTQTVGVTPSAEPTQTTDATPSAACTPPAQSSFDVAVDSTIVPLATPDGDTIVYAMETPPPEQFAFGDLLALNPDTVGFVRLDDVLSLPVVQRPNDNEFYLNHSFNLEESFAGTLFLDGSNLLVPEDNSLIVYGHNMRNGTMFRPLIAYEQLSFLKEHPLLRFDTIYKNRVYAPFAVFTVTTDEGSARYMNIRQFMFDEESWDEYISDMRALSVHDIDIDVEYGDHVLLLVTCEYTHNNGRFVVALRAQREDETTEELCGRIQSAR